MVRFTVLPFSITVAGDVLQWKLDECLGQIKNLIVITDDIMVIGRNQNHKDHDLAFHHTAANCKKVQYQAQLWKTPIQMHTSKFLWGNLAADSYKPAQSKITAIVKMPSPNSKKEIQSFIGMIKYLPKCLPRLTELAKPIREFVKENHLNC